MALKAEPIIVNTSYQAVFRQLEAAILRGELSLGEAIPTEANLCDLFHVKRTTIREGIRLLEQSGLVTRGSGRRLIVSAPDAGRSSENFIRSATLNRVTLQDLWQVERELEALACRLACATISQPQLEQLAENISKMELHKQEPKVTIRLDMEFHRLITDAAGNRALTLARDPLGILLYASTDFVVTRLEQSTERMLAAHRQVYEAISANDPEGAVIWMTKHMDDFKRGCIMAGANFDEPIADFVDHDTLAKLLLQNRGPHDAHP